MKELFILAIVALFTADLYSQETGHVEIVKDPRIDGLVKKKGSIVPPATAPQQMGYRVQLFFDSDRKSVDEARNRFQSTFPKMEAYIIYNAPNYFLKVGDFRTLLEAEKVKEALNRDFPASFIVKELINLPKLDVQ